MGEHCWNCNAVDCEICPPKPAPGCPTCGHPWQLHGSPGRQPCLGSIWSEAYCDCRNPDPSHPDTIANPGVLADPPAAIRPLPRPAATLDGTGR